MANEIQFTGSLVINDQANYKLTLAPGAVNADLSSKIAAAGVQTIGTVAETVAIGDVSTAGWSFFRNLSATSGEYVDVGVNTSTFAGFIRLYPGEYAISPIATTVVLARASTSQTNSISLQYHIQSR